MPTATSRMLSRNGTRQPQERKSSGLSTPERTASIRLAATWLMGEPMAMSAP